MTDRKSQEGDTRLTPNSFASWSLETIPGDAAERRTLWESYQPALPDTWSVPKRDLHFLEALFGSRSRARALAYLVAGRGHEVHLTELARKAGTTAPTLRKSLAPLLAVGILRQRTEGNRLYLAVNPEHPANPGIAQLIKAAVGEARKNRPNHLTPPSGGKSDGTQ